MVCACCVTNPALPDPFLQIAIRSNAPLADLTSRLRGLLAEVNPAIDIDFRPFETTVRESLLRDRLIATLSGFFGLLAASIAAIGLYGVTSYLAARLAIAAGLLAAVTIAASYVPARRAAGLEPTAALREE